MAVNQFRLQCTDPVKLLLPDKLSFSKSSYLFWMEYFRASAWPTKAVTPVVAREDYDHDMSLGMKNAYECLNIDTDTVIIRPIVG